MVLSAYSGVGCNSQGGNRHISQMRENSLLASALYVADAGTVEWTVDGLPVCYYHVLQTQEMPTICRRQCRVHFSRASGVLIANGGDGIPFTVATHVAR